VTALTVPCAAGGAGLQAAVVNANKTGAGRIVLAKGCTYTLDHPASPGGPDGLEPIKGALLIDGNGATIARNSAAPPFRILETAPTATLKIDHVTITGGDATGGVPVGGGISNAGVLTVTGSTISGNRVENKGFGGGIYNAGASVVGVDYCVLNGCPAAAFVWPVVNPSGGTGQVTLVASTVENNTAYYGGGIAASWGPYVYESAVTLHDSTVSGNTGVFGGGLFGTMAITGSRIVGNRANADPTRWGPSPWDGGEGGGIYTGESSIKDTVVSANVAAGDGGGISGDVDMERSSVTNNVAGLNGGGLYVYWWVSTSTIVESQITNNRAAEGGGIYHDGAGMAREGSTVSANEPDNCGPGDWC